MGEGMRGPSPEVRLPPGTRIQVHGLQSATGTQHNSKHGMVRGFNPASRRYTVSLHGTGEQVALKALNIRQVGVQARVAATTDPSLTNMPCQVVEFNAASGRYYVQTQNGRTVALNLDKLALEPDTLVRLHGLQRGAEHNGRWGRIQSFDAEAGRYAVQLDDYLVRIRPVN